MMKRGVCILLILAIALNAVSVLGDTSVVLSPTEAYETNSVSFELNVSNFRGAYEITGLEVLSGGFDVSALVDYKGWTESYNGSFASWYDGSIANNVVLSIFEFLADAPLVDEDQEKETEVTLIDDEGQEHTYTFPITIRNDETAPELSDIIPQDGDFVKEGTTDQPVQVDAQDPETGIANVSFHWVRCNFEENITPQDHTLQLAPYGGVYQNTVDLSNYLNEQQVCFDFTAYNKGGESTEYEGTLTVDGVPPEVTLVSPVDGAIIGLSKNFSFFTADNLATVMDCSMDIDGSEYMTDIEAEHMDVIFIPSADAEEGQHTWSIRCDDPAGWTGTSATWAYTLDKTPPQIVMTAPENNSIIADSTLLEFEVTDNNQVKKVWIVQDGNATEVGGVFSIDVSSWPEGPSEFAVRAEDSVGNQAEQTYRIIVDRTPPEVILASPADNGTSDVHVDFRYMVLDNYDNAIDCRIYIDDIGQEMHTAEGGAETSQPKILAIGAYRWKVQCVDDAMNSAESEERQLSVIDTTGPDIVMENTDLVFRGDPVEISLVVTDISGVDAVSAELRDPNGTSQSVPLEKLADTYTATIGTTLNSLLGTYTLDVYAVDTLNNSNTAADEIILTYRYIVALELTPASTSPGVSVTASGLVIYDDGNDVPEELLTLQLPGNVTEEVELLNGTFTHAFTAPASDGAYDVVASVTSADNGQTYTSTEILTVATPQVQVNGGNGGGGSGGSGNYRPNNDDAGSCSADWSCTAWNPCADGEQKRTCVDLNKCNTDDVRRQEKQSCTADEEEETDDDTTTEGDTVSAAREPLPKPEEHKIDATEEDEGNAAGIGKAAGFMSLLNLNLFNILFALILMTILIGTLYKYGWSRGDNRKRPAAVDFLGGKGDKLGLESYINDRAVRRGRF